MTSYIRMYVVPNCGLSIEVEPLKEGTKTIKVQEGRAYKVVGPEEFASQDGTISGMMSPMKEVSLPRAAKKIAGIPRSAAHYAYIHPSYSLATLINWENFKPKTIESATKIDKDRINREKDPLLQTTHYFAMPFVSMLGGFAYFDAELNFICVNALSFLFTPWEIKILGPFDLTNENDSKALIKSNRVHVCTLSVFHEAGFVGEAWVDEEENFEDMPRYLKHSYGGFVYFKDDGTCVTYIIQPSTYVCDDTIACIPNEAYQAINAFIMEASDADTNESNPAFTTFIPDDKNYLISHTSSKNATIESNLNEPSRATMLLDAFSVNPDYELINRILEHSPQLALQPDQLGRYPLHLACNVNAPVEIITKLLDVDPDKEALSKKTLILGKIPIHIACGRGCSNEVIQKLLEEDKSGQTIATKTYLGYLPLHIAVNEKLPEEIIKILLEKGRIKESTFEIDEVTNFQSRKNFFHIIQGNFIGDDINQICDGLLPIHIACCNKSSAGTVSLLLNKDEMGETVLKHIGRQSLCGQSFQLGSINFGANTSISCLRNLNGKLPIHLALQYGSSIDVVKLLLEKQSTVLGRNKRMVLMCDEYRKCPLHYACQYSNNFAIIEMLLHVDPTKETTQLVDNLGYMPIHYLKLNKKDSADILKILLESEAQFRQNQKLKKQRATHMLVERYRSLLFIAVQEDASDDVLDILLKPEHFNLERFDDVLSWKLARRIKSCYALKVRIIEKISERFNFFLLFADFYINIVTLLVFLSASDSLYAERLSYTQLVILYNCSIILTVREFTKFWSMGYSYFYNVFSWLEIGRIVCLFLATREMWPLVISRLSEIQVTENQVWLYKLTGILVLMQSILIFRSTFLPFARFVGGLIMIILTLIPFFIAATLFLIMFAHMYLVDKFIVANTEGCTLDDIDTMDCCNSLLACFYAVFNGFVSGNDDTRHMQDVIFSICAIVILLNIVIAIVLEGWEYSKAEAETVFWRYRLAFLSGSQYYGKRFHGKKNFLTSYINKVPVLRIKDSFLWIDEPYNVVSCKEEYENPHNFFHPKIADKIKEARSLQADLYWIAGYGQDQSVSWSRVTFIKVILRWVVFSFIYFFLIVLGSMTGGIFWPKHFRIALSGWGIAKKSETESNKTKAFHGVESSQLK